MLLPVSQFFKRFFYFSSLVFTYVALPAQSDEKVLDFSSVNSYFDIVDKLVEGQSVSEEMWKTLFNSEGNKNFIIDNNSVGVEEGVKSSMIEVLTPKSVDSLSIKLSDNPYNIYQSQYKKNLKEIRLFVDSIQKNPDKYILAMSKLTEKHLPMRMQGKTKFPKIFFVTLGEPSAGKQGIYLDIMVEFECNKQLYGAMASHELHHIFRRSLLDDVKFKDNDKGLMYAIDAVHNEGIANHVDKPALLSEDSDWFLKPYFEPMLQASPQVIIDLERMILMESKGSINNEDKYRAVLLNSVGHIPGYYMAKHIVEAGFEEELIETSDNPFQFFQLYNKAVNGKELPKFSLESLAYIKKLEKRYIPKIKI